MKNAGDAYGFRRARGARGLSQSEAAARIGISSNTLGRWEKGVTEPNAAQLDQMASAYGCSTDQLLGRAPLVARSAE